MQFKIWLEQKEIKQPYYRVINNMFGSSGEGTDQPLTDNLGPGSYWTPRWEGVVSMLASTFNYYLNSRLKDDEWKTTVWQIDNAIMNDPPKDHKWAFNYASDVGEQVLVKALSPPKVAKDPDSGVLLKNIHPKDSIFRSIAFNFLSQPKTIDYKNRGAEVVWNGKTVYLWPDSNSIIVKGEPNPNKPWEFSTLKIIKSKYEWEQFIKESEFINPNSDGADAISWFIHDMKWY